MFNFNSLTEFKPEQIASWIALASELERNPRPHALEGKVMAMLFLNPSLRTLSSFQAAMTRLGGGTFVISPEMSIYGLESRSGIIMDGAAAEHINEAVPVIASYGDVVGIRAFALQEHLADDLSDKRYKELAKLAGGKPVINMESSIQHPCQNLADWKTMQDYGIPSKNGKIVLAWTNHPEPMPFAVPASTLTMCAMRGMDVTVLAPEGYQLPESVILEAQQIAQQTGASISQTSSRQAAMEGANVVYASSWSTTKFYGRHKEEGDFKRQLNPGEWCVGNDWFTNAHDQCRFMHCLPIRRGVSADDAVLDSMRSIVISEAKNRMLVQMAVLHEMLA